MSRRAGHIRIGLSGWNYPHWRGEFYPNGLRHRDELAYCGTRFDTIELNGTFYSLKRPEHFAAWYAAVPDEFVFAVKGSRFITHMLKLREAETALANFFASGVLALRDKLGPFLWQLPAQLGFDAARIEAFLALLPRDTETAAALARRHDARVAGRSLTETDRRRELRHAIEVRHPGFLDPGFVALLRRHNVALVFSDGAGLPYTEDVTADFVYLRLHGTGARYTGSYDDEALDGWAARIAAWAAGSQPGDARLIDACLAPPHRPRDVYVYFDNDAWARAPFDAQALRRRLPMG